MASTNTGTARGESPSTVSGSIYEEFSPGRILKGLLASVTKVILGCKDKLISQYLWHRMILRLGILFFPSITLKNKINWFYFTRFLTTLLNCFSNDFSVRDWHNVCGAHQATWNTSGCHRLVVTICQIYLQF